MSVDSLVERLHEHGRFAVGISLDKLAATMTEEAALREIGQARRAGLELEQISKEINANPKAFSSDLRAQLLAHQRYTSAAQQLMSTKMLDDTATAGNVGAALPFFSLMDKPGPVLKRFLGLSSGAQMDDELDDMGNHYGNFQRGQGAPGGVRTLAYEALTGDSRVKPGVPKLTPAMAKLMTPEQAQRIIAENAQTLPVMFSDVLKRWDEGERSGRFVGAGGAPATRQDFLDAFSRKARVLYRPEGGAPLDAYGGIAKSVSSALGSASGSVLTRYLGAWVLRLLAMRGTSMRKMEPAYAG
jgi:hypothetical protein